MDSNTCLQALTKSSSFVPTWEIWSNAIPLLALGRPGQKVNYTYCINISAQSGVNISSSMPRITSPETRGHTNVHAVKHLQKSRADDQEHFYIKS